MLVYIYYTIWIINIFLLLVNIRSRIVSVLSYVFLIIIFGGNTVNGDIYNYLRIYNSSRIEGYSFGIGFRFLMNLAKSFGLNWYQFAMLVAIIGLSIILYIYKKYTDNTHAFYTIYYSIFLFYDINQIRNFMLVVCLFVSFHFLYQYKKVHALIALIIGISFHYLGIVYLPLCFVDFEKKRTKTFFRNGVIIIFVFCIAIFLNGNRIPYFQYYIETILFEIDPTKLYYTEKAVRLGFLLSYLLQFFNFFLVLFSINQHRIMGTYDSNARILNLLWFINLYGFIGFPFVMINHNFYRIFRNFCALDSLAIGIVPKNPVEIEYKVNAYRAIMVFFTIIYMLVWRYGIMFKYRDYTQINTILTNNIFFQVN